MSDESKPNTKLPNLLDEKQNESDSTGSQLEQLAKQQRQNGGDLARQAANRTQIPLLPLLDRETVQALGVLVSNSIIDLMDNWHSKKHIIKLASPDDATDEEIEACRNFTVERGTWIMGCIEALDQMYAAGMFSELEQATEERRQLARAEAEFAAIPKEKLQ